MDVVINVAFAQWYGIVPKQMLGRIELDREVYTHV